MTILKTRTTRQESERLRQVETIKAKVRGFGETTGNPVKGEIAQLRSLRQAGTLSDAAYAVKVAALLGSSDAPIAYPSSTG